MSLAYQLVILMNLTRPLMMEPKSGRDERRLDWRDGGEEVRYQ